VAAVFQSEIGKYFDAEAVMDNGTTVVITDARVHCEPPPFLVGGKLAVFLGVDEPLPFGCCTALGDPAGTPETGALYLGGTLQTELQRGEFPSLDSFAQLLDVSPEAEAISFVHGAFLYEYPEADEETHRLRTLALPLRINNCPVSTLNGPIMLRKHLRRSLQPMPQTLSDEIWDDSQYEVLRPGVKLSGIEGELCRTCAGVLVEKGDEVRLTVAEHGFAPATPTAYHANTVASSEVRPSAVSTEVGSLSVAVRERVCSLFKPVSAKSCFFQPFCG
jgi:hypothetical protein